MKHFGRGVAAAVVALALLSGCEPREGTTPTRPNLVLIVIDTLRADRLPFYGHSDDTAPFLTSLAERSLVFTNAHSTSSWTAPAMASMFLSLHPFQHGMHVASLSADRASFEIMVLPDAVPTLAESLREIGYETFAVVDNQNVSQKPGFDRGFDRFAATQYEAAPQVNATLDDWRGDILSSQPFFLYVHYMDPHMPYHERQPWYGAHPLAGKEGDYEDRLARYDSEIQFVDSYLENFFASFSWPDDTVVLITSDHGEEFGDHGGEQHGRTLYTEVVDVPLLLHAPSRWPEGQRIDRRVSLVDVAPTLLGLAGHPGVASHVGRTLVPDAGAVSASERSIYAQLIWDADAEGRKERRESRAVIRGNYKFLANDSSPDELFDLGLDGRESRSVLDAKARVAERLGADLERRVREEPRFEPGTARIPLDPDQVKKLRALGYAK